MATKRKLTTQVILTLMRILHTSFILQVQQVSLKGQWFLRGIDRLVHEPNYVELNNQTVILLSGTVAFDAATFEIYGALLNGGCLVLTSKDTLLNPVQLGSNDCESTSQHDVVNVITFQSNCK